MRIRQLAGVLGIAIALAAPAALAQEAAAPTAPVVGGAVRIETDAGTIHGTLVDKLPTGYLVRVDGGGTVVIAYEKVRSIEAENGSVSGSAAGPAPAAAPPPAPAASTEPPDVRLERKKALASRKALSAGDWRPAEKGALPHTDPPFIGAPWGKGAVEFAYTLPLVSAHEKSKIVGSFHEAGNFDLRIQPEWRLTDDLDMATGVWFTNFDSKVDRNGIKSYSTLGFVFPLLLRGYLRFGDVRTYLGLGACIAAEHQDLKPFSGLDHYGDGFGYGLLYQLGTDWNVGPGPEGMSIGAALEAGGPQLEEHVESLGEKPTNVGPLLPPLGLNLHFGGMF